MQTLNKLQIAHGLEIHALKETQRLSFTKSLKSAYWISLWLDRQERINDVMVTHAWFSVWT